MDGPVCANERSACESFPTLRKSSFNSLTWGNASPSAGTASMFVAPIALTRLGSALGVPPVVVAQGAVLLHALHDLSLLVPADVPLVAGMGFDRFPRAELSTCHAHHSGIEQTFGQSLTKEERPPNRRTTLGLASCRGRPDSPSGRYVAEQSGSVWSACLDSQRPCGFPVGFGLPGFTPPGRPGFGGLLGLGEG